MFVEITIAALPFEVCHELFASLVETRRSFAHLRGAVLAAACQTMPRVHAESAPGTDMARYTTFGFFEKLGTDQHGYTTIATTHLKEAVSRELEARGMHPAANPDVLVNFYVQTKDKVEELSRFAGFGYSRFGWHGAGWGGGFAAPDVHTYTEGTLTIDLVDRQKNALAWQGVAIGRLDERAMGSPPSPSTVR